MWPLLLLIVVVMRSRLAGMESGRRRQLRWSLVGRHVPEWRWWIKGRQLLDEWRGRRSDNVPILFRMPLLELGPREVCRLSIESGLGELLLLGSLCGRGSMGSRSPEGLRRRVDERQLLLSIDQSLTQRRVHLVVVVRVVVACLLSKPRVELIALEGLRLVLRLLLLLLEAMFILMELVVLLMIVLVIIVVVKVLLMMMMRTGSLWGNGGRGQCDNRLDGTLLVLLLQLMALLRFVFRSESHMDSAVAVEFLRIRSDNGTQCGGLDGRGQGDNQWLLLVVLRQFLFVIVVLLVVGVGRKCSDRIIDDDTFVRVLLVLDVEHLHLLLLLLLAREEDGL